MPIESTRGRLGLAIARARGMSIKLGLVLDALDHNVARAIAGAGPEPTHEDGAAAEALAASLRLALAGWGARAGDPTLDALDSLAGAPPAPVRRLGLEVRAIRDAAAMTQADLAERLGARQASVSDWERGKRVPGPRSIGRLAAMAPDGGARLLEACRMLRED